jgi:predicted ATPase
LELLKTLPDTPTHAQHELTLYVTLGTPLMATKGLAAPEVERVYARARELCGQVGQTPQIFPVLVGLWRFYLSRAEYQTAYELDAQLLRLAQDVKDPALLLEAHRGPGQTLFFLGQFVQARRRLEQAITLYDPQHHRSHAFLYGHDAKVTCLSFTSLVLGLLGFPAQALEKSHEALTLARELSHPHSLALALVTAALFHQHRREKQAVRACAEEALTLSTEQGFPFYVAIGTILRGWALAPRPDCLSGGRGRVGAAVLSCPHG